MAILEQLVENGKQTKLKHNSMRNFGMAWEKLSYRYSGNMTELLLLSKCSDEIEFFIF